MAHTDLDYSHLPHGQRALRAFLKGVAQAVTLSERDFIEIKSDIDLSGKEGRAKLAKFVLGAANRDPATSAKRLDGHAVLILGISSGEVKGIPSFEAHEVRREVERFIGGPGPEWDHDSIALDEDRVAVMVFVRPQPEGQPWLCRADGLEKMVDGRIYLRLDGETREAKAAHVDAMLRRRTLAATPQTDIQVAVTGHAYRYEYDPSLLSDFIEATSKRLLKALPKKSAPNVLPPAVFAAIRAAESLTLGWSDSEPESRTEEQYRAEIERWADDVREAFPAVMERMLGYSLPAARLQVVSQRGYLEQPEFELHIDGAVEGVERETDDPESWNFPPRPPRPWGPRPSTSPLAGAFDVAVPAYDFARMLPPADGSVSFRNGGSVSLRSSFGEMRPGQTYVSPENEVALVWNGDGDRNQLTGTWRCTVKGHDEAYGGQVIVPVAAETVSLNELLRSMLGSGV